MIRFIHLLSVALFASMCAACSPGLGAQIALGPVELPDDSAAAPARYNPSSMRVQLRPFVDGRQSRAIASINGREVEPLGDPALPVQEAFEAYLQSQGIETHDPEAPIIGGQIEHWYVTVAPGFPASQATAEATIVVELSNIENQLVYRGKYSGSTTTSHPLLNENKIAEALSQAMGYAINEVLRDERLTSKISNTFRPIY